MRAQQRVGLVDAFDEHEPVAAVELGLLGEDRLVLAGAALMGIRIGLAGGLFGAEAASLVGIVAVIADKVFALAGDVLR